MPTPREVLRSILVDMKKEVERAKAEADRHHSRVVITETEDIEGWIKRIETALATPEQK